MKRTLMAGCAAALLASMPVRAQHDLGLGETRDIVPRYLLQDVNGRATTPEDHYGYYQLIAFGYTFCPDICPTSLAFASQALSALNHEELAHTQMLFISVDPERDTPEKLKEYGAFFHPNILGLTGTPEVIATTAKLYGASYRKQDTGSAGGYVVDHSSSTYVVDPNGKLTATLPHGTPPVEVVKAIRAAMQNR